MGNNIRRYRLPLDLLLSTSAPRIKKSEMIRISMVAQHHFQSHSYLADLPTAHHYIPPRLPRARNC